MATLSWRATLQQHGKEFFVPLKCLLIQLLKNIGAQESRKVKVEGHITTTLHRFLGTDEVSVYTSVEGDRGPGV